MKARDNIRAEINSELLALSRFFTSKSPLNFFLMSMTLLRLYVIVKENNQGNHICHTIKQRNFFAAPKMSSLKDVVTV